MKKNILYRLAFYILVLVPFIAPAYAGYSQDADPGENEGIERAIWEYKHENYEEAYEVLKVLRKDEPESSLIAYYMGITCKQLQDYSGSIKHLEDAANLKPRIKNAVIELIDVLYKKNRIKEARKWIKVAEEEDMLPAQITFLKGLVLLKEGKDVEGAVRAFEKAKELDEKITNTADYYIGLAYIKQENLKDAKKLFDEISSQSPGSSLAAFADQYIDAIERKEEAEKVFRGYMSAAFQYDDNVVLNPGETALTTGGISTQTDFRQVYNANAEFNVKPADYFGTRAGYTLYYAKQNDLGFYDTVNHTVYANPAFYLKDVAITFPVRYGILNINDIDYLSMVEVGNLNNVKMGDNQMWQAAFFYKNENYLWIPSLLEEDRDSDEYSGYLGYFLFFAKNKGFINFKYALNYDQTKGRNWRYAGYKGTITALLPITEKLRAGGSVDLFLQRYKEVNSVYNKLRKDNILTVGTFLIVDMLEDLELQFSFNYIEDESNINVYTYKRNIYSIGLKMKF